MKNVYPDYYSTFKCTAGKCRHSCCRGWEIDIDEAAMERFSAVGGEFGKRLRESIAGGDEPHFVLDENERCPFLSSSNLCDIILNMGEDAICQICTDHPRFRTFLSDRTEIGLGLCCEEAARLILSQNEPFMLVSTGTESLEDDELALLDLRAEVFDVLQDKAKSIDLRIEEMLALTDAEVSTRSVGEWADFFLGLERMDEEWTSLLANLSRNADKIDFAGFDAYMQSRQQEYENLLLYFVYRHFMSALEDGDIVSKLRFAAAGYMLIHALGAVKWQQTGEFSLADQIEYARLFSSEIEYSQENLDAMFDELM